MYYILLVLNLVAIIFGLFAKNHNVYKKISLIMILSMSFIAFHEKAYYLAIALIFELYFVFKTTSFLTINEKPQEDILLGKNYYWTFVISVLFMMLFSGYLFLINEKIKKINLVNLNFTNIEVYKLIILLLITSLLFMNKRQKNK